MRGLGPPGFEYDVEGADVTGIPSGGAVCIEGSVEGCGGDGCTRTGEATGAHADVSAEALLRIDGEVGGGVRGPSAECSGRRSSVEEVAEASLAAPSRSRVESRPDSSLLCVAIRRSATYRSYSGHIAPHSATLRGLKPCSASKASSYSRSFALTLRWSEMGSRSRLTSFDGRPPEVEKLRSRAR